MLQSNLQTILSQPTLICKEQCKRSLSEFIKRAWHVIEPSNPYCHNWHIDAMAEHLEAVTNGQINRLLINVPPGMMKSLLVSVFYPAWEWGARGLSHYRYISCSHAQSLAIRDHVKMRRLITSDWYRDRWNVQLVDDQNTKTKFENTDTGFRQAIASKGITGARGDRVIVDDPHSVDSVMSDAERQTTLDWFAHSLPLRVVNPEKSTFIVVMQRLRQNDISGYILKKELGYEHLCLPMKFEPQRTYHNVLGFVDPRTKEGELLFPQRFPQSVVDRDSKVMGSLQTAGQFQQRPAPAGGSIFLEKWFMRYAALQKYKRIIISLDTGYKESELNDPSVATVWGEHALGYDLIEVYKDRLSYPKLKKQAISLAQRYSLNQSLYAGHKLLTILIEDKASGQSLIQDLRLTNYNVVAIQPEGDKVVRASTCSPQIENGKVFLPFDANWLDDYIEEMTTFPNSSKKDQVDSTSQFLNWISGGAGEFTDDFNE